MKRLMVLVVLMLALPMQSQNITYPCDHQDIFDIYQLLVAELSEAVPAVDAQDTEWFLRELTDLEYTIRELRDFCAYGGTDAGQNAGDQRSNPVPMRQRQMIRDGEQSVAVLLYVDDANEVMIDNGEPPPTGKRFVYAQLAVRCELSANERCNATTGWFNLVGRKSIVYSDHFTMLADSSQFLFGGGEANLDYVALVDADDSDMVLFEDRILSTGKFFELVNTQQQPDV